MSGWITTGPRTKKLEEKVAECIDVDKVVCLNLYTDFCANAKKTDFSSYPQSSH